MIELTADDLFRKIGQLVMENEALRAELEQAVEQPEPDARPAP